MELKTTAGKKVKLDDAVFAREFNETLVHQTVVTYMAGARAGTKAQKNRSAVSGGGIKPWRQKGTGRARAGTIRSPIWRSGGVTFAAQPRSFEKKINKKMYRAAISSIFSELVRQDRLIIVDDVAIKEPKTKLMLKQLDKLKTTNALIVTEEAAENVSLSVRNIPHCDAVDVSGLNPVNLVAHESVVITAGALTKVQEWLA